jgi:hypothetical protein
MKIAIISAPKVSTIRKSKSYGAGINASIRSPTVKSGKQSKMELRTLVHRHNLLKDQKRHNNSSMCIVEIAARKPNP